MTLEEHKQRQDRANGAARAAAFRARRRNGEESFHVDANRQLVVEVLKYKDLLDEREEADTATLQIRLSLFLRNVLLLELQNVQQKK